MASTTAIRAVWKNVGPRLFPDGFGAATQAVQQWIEEPNRLVGAKSVSAKKSSPRERPSLRVILTPNPEQIVQAADSSALADAFSRGDVLLPDGTGVLWMHAWWRLVHGWRDASRLRARARGRELVAWWLRYAKSQQVRTLLLGAKPGIAEHLARESDSEKIWCLGNFGYTNVKNALSEPDQQSESEERHVRDLITKWQPRVILVAFGAPWQELWIERHREFLASAGVEIAIVCGGAFDVLSGALPTPPKIMATLHLEWLFRLWVEPQRWRRQLRWMQFLMALL